MDKKFLEMKVNVEILEELGWKVGLSEVKTYICDRETGEYEEEPGTYIIPQLQLMNESTGECHQYPLSLVGWQGLLRDADEIFRASID